MSEGAASASAPVRGHRETSIDIFKGLLVIGMVFCHSLQFFSDQQVYPAGQHWIDLINLITFSGFVFSFGYVSQLAYYSKTFRQSAPRMLLTAIKMLIAFWLSGTAYRLFIDGRPLSWAGIRPILLIEEMPGWSEFLISFAYMTFAGLILYIPLKWLVKSKAAGFGAAFLLLAATFIPYGAVHSIPFAPLIGTRDVASFPVLQYVPYYLIGMLFAKYKIRWDLRVFTGALVASALFFWQWKFSRGGALPERFPPSVWWIIGPAVILYGLYLLARALDRYPRLLQPFTIMGSNVLWFLLMSNLLIFSVAGSQQTYGFMVGTAGAFGLAAALLLVAGFSLWIMRPVKRAGRPRNLQGTEANPFLNL